MYWIYDIPRWMGTFLFAVVFVGFTWLGLVLIRPGSAGTPPTNPIGTR